MKESKLQSQVVSATKWSTITEIAAKIVSPITNMILARILIPEDFGVVATITMIVSFADMFTDSGFQKYLVQHEFKGEEEKHQNANVAFWTNLGISLVLWLVIAAFSDQLATLVGSPGLGNVVTIACLQLPLTAFSSIQMALYRRDFDFKTLFVVRLFAIGIPFVITIPLAYFGFGYWALIIGSLAVQLSNAVILTIKSKWKPKLYYSVSVLKEMLSFSIWSLIEAISIWLTSWIDTFIIGNALNDYYLGIYKTSITMVNSLMALITSSVVPVLFSALSRVNEEKDDEKFNNIFFKFQRLVSVIVLPLGVGVFLYSDLATQILLGDQWSEASGVIGIWALTSAIVVVLGNFNSEVYRAKGRPKVSFLSQMLHLVFLVPVLIVSSKQGFWPLVYARSFARLQGVLVGLILMHFVMKISTWKILKNVFPTALCATAMGFFGYFLQQLNSGLVWDIISIVLCAVFYFLLLLLFPDIRKEILTLTKKVLQRNK